MPAPNPICYESQNLHAADAVESRIVNNLEDQKEDGDQRKHRAGDNLSRYLDHAAATFSAWRPPHHGEIYHIRGSATHQLVSNRQGLG